LVAVFDQFWNVNGGFGKLRLSNYERSVPKQVKSNSVMWTLRNSTDVVVRW